MKKLLLVASLMFLAASAQAQVPSITLDWTAVGDDGTVGRAASYEMRYRNVAVAGTDTLGWWNAATVVTGLPTPAVSGSVETVTVTPAGGFAPGTWFFILRVLDEVPNVSAFSNIASKSVLDALPPARVTDLRVR